jgi:O-antigen ligase
MQWLLIGYLFLFIHRPFEVWPILGELHIERAYMLLTLGYFALVARKRWLPNIQQTAVFAFAGAVLVCWVLSPWMDKGQPVVEDWFKILVFYLLLVTTITDERQLRLVVFAFLVVMAVYMLHSLKDFIGGRHVYRMGIARMVGVDTTRGDPNSFGASIVYALPLVSTFWVSGTRKMRLFLAGYVALSVLCILLTGSRSSLLGLIAWTVFLVLLTRRRFLVLAGVAVLAPLLFMALPESLQNRFETIVDSSVGPENARESGEGRIVGLFVGLELWASNPLTGCGPGAWRPATGSHIESHSLPGQLLGEMGTLGAISFAALLVGYWINCRRIRRLARLKRFAPDDFLVQLARGIGTGVVLMLFLGIFGHNLFRHNWLWYGAFLIVAVDCARRRVYLAGPTTQPPPAYRLVGARAWLPQRADARRLAERGPVAA